MHTSVAPRNLIADVIARRIWQTQTVRVLNAHPRRLAWLAGLRDQPPGPFRPPRSFDMWRRLQPFVRSDVDGIRFLRLDLIAVALLARRRDDACVMATAGQEVRNVGVHLVMYLVGG